MYLKKGKVASTEDNHIITALGNAGVCHLYKEQCITKENILIRDQDKFISGSHYQNKGLYKAQLTENAIYIKDSQLALKYKKSHTLHSA